MTPERSTPRGDPRRHQLGVEHQCGGRGIVRSARTVLRTEQARVPASMILVFLTSFLMFPARQIPACVVRPTALPHEGRIYSRYFSSRSISSKPHRGTKKRVTLSNDGVFDLSVPRRGSRRRRPGAVVVVSAPRQEEATRWSKSRRVRIPISDVKAMTFCWICRSHARPSCARRLRRNPDVTRPSVCSTLQGRPCAVSSPGGARNTPTIRAGSS